MSCQPPSPPGPGPAGIRGDNTERAYTGAVGEFMAFWGISSVSELRKVSLTHVAAWRDYLAGRDTKLMKKLGIK